ncbi:hypothetical protein RhiirA5_52659 [Rhizophagus irregularis]|uniref:Phosphotransferase n=3 Tax=Rhizophagus irregularis TaxID=588596 RepID=U9UBG3_RHIID|nr:hypothetical protein GLOIN_2v1718949 [Rhizophagus irregularis DAOM 181602=DAOM 197198]PKC13925.1 hypothetical protein RhiirA5_52659 [Rhizophagus irregularis]PKC64548.1 hypothetical protein RhiirA1_421470 [Rhizophagus irregularis]PKK71078.1 hypothetical protein RhiirC2_778854 [Rhizophagus irregularis]PKY12481.1 hypothetical protein RhiirB3_164065 [Rhizophagus irregularis]POG59828.1 hypothetical protein GLOIN_2v1718949 [Rhizophagus irregularis DAOM 181602=DAOM 197198]|eukprot:XP_025166694.1 hypothetical protein GLOIN_2v1718949 [Rhizophagus irregularis DAOM 181602=DAOM 197198]
MDEPTPSLEELEEQTFITKEYIEEKIIPGFTDAYRHGFDEDESTMIPSYVCRLPTGMETGTYLSLDLGGTNLRVAAVTLVGDGKTDIEQKQFVIPEELKTVPVETLFDWVADCAKDLLIKIKSLEKEMYMGVSFSFPIKQTDINKGVAMKMGKGFDIPGLVNNDVVELLNDAFVRKKINIHIVAIVNDTVGSLVAYAYRDQNTIASMIIGTGTNAACICETSEIKKQNFPPDSPQYMIVNNEISLMGADFLPKKTKYDKILDSQSSIPGFQPFEKMVSGRYIGELVRLAIVDYVKNCNLFDGKLPGKMEIPYSFSTVHMSEIESDRTYNSANILKSLTQNFKFSEDNTPTVGDMRTVQELVRKFSRRSAHLAVAAVASLIKLQCGTYKNIEREVRIAIDGSIYNSYYKYSSSMSKLLKEIQESGEDKKVKIVSVKNGGIIGAAVTAMMYSPHP